MLSFFRKKTIPRNIITHAYAAIASQARHPALYLEYGVSDTMNMRFEMLVLHLFVVMNWFKNDRDERVREAMQAICDLFFIEMDRAMRETGVGDLSVPKRIKKMARIYAARMATYDLACSTADETAFSRALALHIYGSEEEMARGTALADYIETLRVAMSMTDSLETLENGLWLPAPDAVATKP